jgi:RimJ/RimL family protein N-acetyltransferase
LIELYGGDLFMEGLNLVQYDSSYAKAIAEMWKKSSEGWNGGFADATEESVLKELEASTSINIYLAEKEGEILGLCDFSQYLEDEGALYIKLLNVRYDCHGQGIGRTMVCKSIIRTEELGWPRLDLYTWPGNTKSIPLYKRCGFFLEDRDDTTHLMNFIPYVLGTEAVKEYFKYIDWYGDLKRTIDMEPDGREENGFDYYEYI